MLPVPIHYQTSLRIRAKADTSRDQESTWCLGLNTECCRETSDIFYLESLEVMPRISDLKLIHVKKAYKWDVKFLVALFHRIVFAAVIGLQPTKKIRSDN